MAQKTTLTELDNASFIEAWNDKSLTNKDLAAKLEANWVLIYTKATRVKQVASELKVKRTGGINGTWEDLDTVAPAATAATATVSREAVPASASGTLHVHVKLMSSSSTMVAEAHISAANTEDCAAQMQRLMSENRVTKADLYRGGASISPAEIVDGDELVIRPAIFNA